MYEIIILFLFLPFCRVGFMAKFVLVVVLIKTDAKIIILYHALEGKVMQKRESQAIKRLF